MTSNQKNWTVFLGTLLAIGLPVVARIRGSTDLDEDVGSMLRLTAFVSFAIYLLIFVTRPTRDLWNSPPTRALLRNRRYFGIAFAASHTVHLGLIVRFVLDRETPPETLLFGGIAYALVYLMLITSFDAPARAIGPVAWRRLHKTGLYWIGAIFAISLVPDLFEHPGDISYAASTLLILAAVGLRALAFVKNRNRHA